MSCSHPISCYTNSKYIYRGVSRWKQSFACGCCSGCISKQRAEWRVRCYYEALSTLDHSNDSFVLFDTLTYSDEHIKRYSDIFPDMEIPEELDKTSFCRRDVQTFFKRLRISLSRAGYPVKDNLRYILTSEYGTSEKTRGFENTHRPHYHLLFFVTFSIDPVVFSRFVSEAWICGKTDGVPPSSCNDCCVRKFCNGYCIYKSPEYVRIERVISNSTTQNCIKCVNYVTKYISKDMYFFSQLSRNVENLFRWLYSSDFDSLAVRRFYRKFRSQVLPFHLQSIGFGLSALDHEEEKEYMIKYNQIRVPSQDASVVTSISLPRYYGRKLFYTFKKINGRVVWQLTDYGVDVKVSQLDNKIEQFVRDYQSFDPSFPVNRLYDLALYNCVYKGTIADRRSLCLPYKQYYRKMLLSNRDSLPMYFNFNTPKDKYTIGRFVSPSYFIDEDGVINFKGKQLHKEFIPFDGYFVVSDKLNPFWFGFDKCLSNYQKYRNSIGNSKDIIQYYDDIRVDNYKQIGLL